MVQGFRNRDMNNLTLREKEKLRRRKQILGAARRVFGRRGFHESTLAEIAREAHLGKATLYWYFADKATLLRAVFEDAINEQLRAVEQVIHDVPDCRSRLEAIALGQFEHFVKNQYVLRISTSETGFAMDQMKRELKSFLMSKYGIYVRLLESVFVSGMRKKEIRNIDAEQMSHLFISMLHSIAWTWHVRGVKPQPDKDARQVCDMVFEGLRKR
ncbi:MAG: TetR/AcrR family transcriptional regulator [Candidatus Eisenbacteria bacterium]|nr:TetR/AcrR family transcriptional regulator [Candidatus Eisenbacteria bacterium]